MVPVCPKAKSSINLTESWLFLIESGMRKKGSIEVFWGLSWSSRDIGGLLGSSRDIGGLLGTSGDIGGLLACSGDIAGLLGSSGDIWGLPVTLGSSGVFWGHWGCFGVF